MRPGRQGYVVVLSQRAWEALRDHLDRTEQWRLTPDLREAVTAVEVAESERK